MLSKVLKMTDNTFGVV